MRVDPAAGARSRIARHRERAAGRVGGRLLRARVAAARPRGMDQPGETDEKAGAVGRVGYEINFNRYFYRYEPPRRWRRSRPTARHWSARSSTCCARWRGRMTESNKGGETMQTIHATEKTGSDGALTLRLALDRPDTEYEEV